MKRATHIATLCVAVFCGACAAVLGLWTAALVSVACVAASTLLSVWKEETKSDVTRDELETLKQELATVSAVNGLKTKRGW